MLRNALAGRDIMDVKTVNKFDRRIIEYLFEVQECAGRPADPGSFKNGWGGAEYSLKVALHAVITTTSFEDCMLTVGLAGGDTDTYGAIAGALAGAIYGTSAIPRTWLNTILGKKPMQRYATNLHERQMESID